VGYLSGPVFFAQAQIAQAVGGTPAADGGPYISNAMLVGIGVGVVVLGVGTCAIAGCFDSGGGNGSQGQATQLGP